MSVKVRFPPSPTGNLHVGSVRTALLNYLFAKKNKGKLVLRIEDTDKEREVKEAYDSIYDSLKWLGIDWDEGPILQSDRLDIYKKHNKDLIDKGLAYENDGATYLKTPKNGQTKWTDLIIKKEISFENKDIEDFVIYKSNGFPVYHFANVIDDHLNGITHVLRGEDIMSSTPRQLMIYEAFEWRIPEFGHLPVILATDRSKLSKRHGAVGILDFKKDGFLPEAILNYLVLIGWTPPSGKEIMTLQEMIKEFDLTDIHNASGIFDVTKLTWMNGEYIRKMSDEDLLKRIDEYLDDISKGDLKNTKFEDKEKLKKIIPLIKERIKTLGEFIPMTDFLFDKPEYEKEVFEKLKIDGTKMILQKVLEILKNIKSPWQAEEFEKTFRKLAEELKLSASQMFQLIRVAISGQSVTPPLFESVQILGEEETILRVEQAIKLW